MKFLFTKRTPFSTVIAQGVNAGDLKRLQDAGIYICNGLMINTKKVISSIDDELFGGI